MRRKDRGYSAAAVLLAATLAALAIGSRQAAADAAPPRFPRGSTIGAQGGTTYVKMVSENVVIDVQESQPTGTAADVLAADGMLGLVKATFVMRNDGDELESMDVWFPLGDEWSLGEAESRGLDSEFEAWVDERPARISKIETADDPDDVATWATWPVTFPPGEDVTLEVAYVVVPEGYAPFGTFNYMLRTGGGWWGPIGEGTVTVRLPFEVNATNTVLGTGSAWDTSPRPSGPEVGLRDVVWRFTDLEPTADDDIRLTVLEPARWRKIEQAREDVAGSADSADAQHQLALALEAALQFKQGLIPIGESTSVAAEAEAAYRTALDLAPDDLQIHRDYLGLMFAQCCCPCTPERASPELAHVLDSALDLAPDDGDLLSLQDELALGIEFSAQMEATNESRRVDSAGSEAGGDSSDGGSPVSEDSVAADERDEAGAEEGGSWPCGSGAIVLLLVAAAVLVRFTASIRP